MGKRGGRRNKRGGRKGKGNKNAAKRKAKREAKSWCQEDGNKEEDETLRACITRKCGDACKRKKRGGKRGGRRNKRGGRRNKRRGGRRNKKASNCKKTDWSEPGKGETPDGTECTLNAGGRKKRRGRGG